MSCALQTYLPGPVYGWVECSTINAAVSNAFALDNSTSTCSAEVTETTGEDGTGGSGF
jgi:hypothetical protein